MKLILHLYSHHATEGACSDTIGWGAVLRPGRSLVQFWWFHWHNPSSHTLALSSTRPLTEMSTWNISWGKGGQCIVLTTLPPSCADSWNRGVSTSWYPQGMSRLVQGLLYSPTLFYILWCYSMNSGCGDSWYQVPGFQRQWCKSTFSANETACQCRTEENQSHWTASAGTFNR